MSEEKKPEEKPKKRELTMADMEARPGAMIPLDAAGGLAPRNFTELIAFAKMIASSGMLPKSYDGRYEAAVVAMQMGSEIGLTPMAAIRSIYVVNGQPALWGDGLFALVRSDPRVIDIVERPPHEIEETGEAECTVTVRNHAPVTRRFSMADAKKAGLLDKRGPWQQYPARMAQMRARAWACRDAVPDRLSGIACAEEAQDIDMGEAHFVEPAMAIPPEGTSSFAKKPKPAPEPRPEPEKQTEPEAERDEPEAKHDESPAANLSAKDAIDVVKRVADSCLDKALDQLRAVAAFDIRSTVVTAAQDRIRTIEKYRARQASRETESSDPADKYDNIGPGEWPGETEEEPPPSDAELEAAGQQKMGGAGF